MAIREIVEKHPECAAVFEKFLDSPRRVILEVEPTQRIGYDGGKMGKATAEWMRAQKANEREQAGSESSS